MQQPAQVMHDKAAISDLWKLFIACCVSSEYFENLSSSFNSSISIYNNKNDLNRNTYVIFITDSSGLYSKKMNIQSSNIQILA